MTAEESGIRSIPLGLSQIVAVVIGVGPTGIKFLTLDESVIRLLQESYCYAFDMTMYFALAALVVAIPFALGMQWLNTKEAKIKKRNHKLGGLCASRGPLNVGALKRLSAQVPCLLEGSVYRGIRDGLE